MRTETPSQKTRGHNGEDDNDGGGNKNTCVKWHVTHKPRADISHRRQQSLAAQRGGAKMEGVGVEVDCLHCLMRLMPSVSRFSHSNVQEATGVSEDDPRMGIPQLASSESSGKSLLTHLRPLQRQRDGVSRFQMLAQPP